jgi:hypothetical protein
MKITISFTPSETPALLMLVKSVLNVGASQSVLLTLQRTSNTDFGEGSMPKHAKLFEDTGFQTLSLRQQKQHLVTEHGWTVDGFWPADRDLVLAHTHMSYPKIPHTHDAS